MTTVARSMGGLTALMAWGAMAGFVGMLGLQDATVAHAQGSVRPVDVPKPGVFAKDRPRIDNCAAYQRQYDKLCSFNSTSRECVELKRYIDSRCKD